jgi:hypothetical protein
MLYIDYRSNCNYYDFCFITFWTISILQCFWCYFSFLLSPRQNSWLILYKGIAFVADFGISCWRIASGPPKSAIWAFTCVYHINAITGSIIMTIQLEVVIFVWALWRPVNPVQNYRPKTHCNADWWLYVIQTVPCTGHFRGASELPFTSKDINLQANSGTNYMFVFHNKSGCEGGGED